MKTYVLNYLRRNCLGLKNAKKKNKILEDINIYKREFERCIEILRKEGHPVCSTSNIGYWYDRSGKYIHLAILELERRIKSQVITKNCLKRTAKKIQGKKLL